MNDQVCIGRTLKIIGSKWTIQILHQLCGGAKRFKALERELSGISPRTLSYRLKQLENGNIIKRKIYAQIPLRVEYSLTKRGESLREIIQLMVEWGR